MEQDRSGMQITSIRTLNSQSSFVDGFEDEGWVLVDAGILCWVLILIKWQKNSTGRKYPRQEGMYIETKPSFNWRVFK